MLAACVVSLSILCFLFVWCKLCIEVGCWPTQELDDLVLPFSLGRGEITLHNHTFALTSSLWFGSQYRPNGFVKHLLKAALG